MADVGTVVLTEVTAYQIKKIKAGWTSDSSGNATKTTTESYTGQIIGFICIPNSDSDAPTTPYGV